MGHSRNSINLASWFDVLSSVIFASGLPYKPPRNPWLQAASREALLYGLPVGGIPCLTHQQLLHVLGNPGKDHGGMHWPNPLTPEIEVEG